MNNSITPKVKTTDDLIQQSKKTVPGFNPSPVYTPNLKPINPEITTPITNHGRYMDLEYFRPGMDMDEARAVNQSNFEQVAHGFGKFGIRVVGSAIGTAAGTLDILQSLATHQDMQHGAIGTFFDDVYEKAEEWMPNYYTAAEQARTKVFTANFLADKFLKNAGFTVGTMAAMIATGGASAGVIGKAFKTFSKSSKHLSSISSKVAMLNAAGYTDDAAKVMKELKELGQLTPKSLAKLNRLTNPRIVNRVNSAYQLTNASMFEAASETREGVRQIEQEFIDKRYDINDAKIKDRIEQAGREIFTTNMAILTLSNAMMYGSLLKSKAISTLRPRTLTTSMRGLMSAESKKAVEKSGIREALGMGRSAAIEKAIAAGSMPNGAVGLAAKAASKMPQLGMKSSGVIAAESIGKGIGMIGANVFSEGFYEEGGQFAAQTAAKNKALYGEDDDNFDSFVKNLRSTWTHLGLYKEGRESVLLGAMTGGGATMVKTGVQSQTKKGKLASKQKHQMAQDYVRNLHGMWGVGEEDLRGEFINYYADKLDNANKLHESMRKGGEAIEKLYLNVMKAELSKDPAAIKEANDALLENRENQLDNISLMITPFMNMDEMGAFYDNIDLLGQMDNKEFSQIMGLDEGNVVDDTTKREIIEDVKKQARTVENIHKELNKVKEAVAPHELYTYTKDGKTVSPLLQRLHASLIKISAYGEDVSVLTEDFDEVLRSGGNTAITYDAVAAHAEANNMSNSDALDALLDEQLTESAKKASKNIKEISKGAKANTNNEIIKQDAHALLSTIEHRGNALRQILNTKVELEAALLSNKDKAKELIIQKNKAVKEYVQKHLDNAVSLEEVAAIEDYLITEGVRPELYRNALNKRAEEVDTLETLKDKYEKGKGDNTTNHADNRKKYERAVDMLQRSKRTDLNLEYLNELFAAKEKPKKEKGSKFIKRKLDERAAAKKAKAEKKANKEGDTPTNTPNDETTPTNSKIDDSNVVPPPPNAKQIVTDAFEDVNGTPSKMEDTEVIQYVDEETEQVCDPATGQVRTTGNTKARNGITTPFTPGKKWAVIKRFKGKSHAQGGIDILLNNGKISMTKGATTFTAANGVLITGRDYVKGDDDFPTDDLDNPPDGEPTETDDTPSYKNIPRYNSRDKGSYYYSGKEGSPEEKEAYLNSLVENGTLKPKHITEGFTAQNLDMSKLPDEDFEYYYEYDMLKDWYNSKGAKSRYINAGGNEVDWDKHKKSLLYSLDNVHLKKLKYNNIEQLSGRIKGYSRTKSYGNNNHTSEIIDVGGGWSTAHEATHGMAPEDIPIVGERINNILSEEVDNIDRSPYTDKHVDYLLSPSEITARINQMRFDMYLDPNIPLTEERLERYRKNVNSKGSPVPRQLLDILPNKVLLRLFNEIVDNSNGTNKNTDNLA